MSKTLDRFIDEMKFLISKHSIADEMVSVVARPLTPHEAIGRPVHDDYPLLKGKERMMQATFQNAKGQAYSDHTGNFSGSLSDVMNLPMDSNFHRALAVATANAVLRRRGIIEKSCHCKDHDPVSCASYLYDFLKPFSARRVGMIGDQPRLLEELSHHVAVRVCDRDPDNIGRLKSGIMVEDAAAYEQITRWADLVFATGTTLVNDTIDNFIGGVPSVFYGITISGAAAVLSLNHFCPLGR
ncbi:MAG: Rossmann-like domain-containing protein [Thermodesulfobacteriota bacterium]